MSDYILGSLDFAVRIVELSRWLKDEKKEFPLSSRLMECGTGLGVSLRMAKVIKDKGIRVKALNQIEEVQLLLELMVKTSFITELQSKPLLESCSMLKKEILRQIKAPPSQKEES